MQFGTKHIFLDVFEFEYLDIKRHVHESCSTDIVRKTMKCNEECIGKKTLDAVTPMYILMYIYISIDHAER